MNVRDITNLEACYLEKVNTMHGDRTGWFRAEDQAVRASVYKEVQGSQNPVNPVQFKRDGEQLPLERFANQGARTLRQRHIERRLLCLRRHFFPCLADDRQHFFFLVLFGEIEKIVFQENETGDIFDQLYIGILLQSPLTQNFPNLFDGVGLLGIADAVERIYMYVI